MKSIEQRWLNKHGKTGKATSEFTAMLERTDVVKALTCTAKCVTCGATWGPYTEETGFNDLEQRAHAHLHKHSVVIEKTTQTIIRPK